jgi:type II secretory pathway component PulF
MTGFHSFSSDDIPQAAALQQVLASGLPLATGLRAYAEECPASAKSSLLQLAQAVEAGQSISEAIQAPSLRFPAYLRGLIDGGIRTGTLGPMLEEYLHQRRLQRRFGQKVTLDLAYPLIVIYFSALTCFAMLNFLVPMFEKIFSDFGTNLPTFTLMLLELSRVSLALSLPLSIAFIAVGIALVLYLFGGQWSKALVDRIPFFGGSARYASMSEFCSLLAPLIATSVPLPTALNAVAVAMQPSRLKSITKSLASRYDGSQTLADTARQLKFPNEIVHILRWEERGQAMSEILKSWAELFARIASSRSSVITAIIGPVMMIGIGFFVGLLVIAMFLPLVKLLNELA